MERLNFQRRIARQLLAPSIALICLLPAYSASGPKEKIEITGGAPVVELPSSRRNVESLAPGIAREAPDHGGLDPGFVLPPQTGGGLLNREALKALDERRNWMFVNPYDMDRKTSGLEMLEKRERKSSFNNQEEEKSVMERFFSERTRQREEELSKKNNPFQRRGPSAEESVNPLQFDNGSLRDRDDDEFSRELSLGDYLGPRPNEQRQGFAELPVPKQTPFNITTLADRPELSVDQEREHKLRQEFRAAEFQKLLQPRNLTPSISGLVDPLNTQRDPTRVEFNPIAPQRAEQMMNFGRGDTASSPLRTSPEVGNSGYRLDSFAAQAPSAPTLAPGLRSQSAAPAVAAPAFSGSPFQLELPKRKF